MKFITDEQKDLVKLLYTKAHIPCDEIAVRIGFSRQSVHQILRKMDVRTQKTKIATTCSMCGEITEKRRSEFRKNENHFCSPECYARWSRRPDIMQLNFDLKAAKDRAMAAIGFEKCVYAGFFIDGNDVLVFGSRDEMIEWKRTGLPHTAFSINQNRDVVVTHRGGRAVNVHEEGKQEAGRTGARGGGPQAAADDGRGRAGRNHRRRSGP